MKTIDFSYFIESYNAGEMNQAEKNWFMKELDGNESLQKEVLLRKQADNILKRQDILSLRNKLNSIENSRKTEVLNKEKHKTPRFRYAAVFTGVLVIGSLLFYSYRPQSPEKLYDRYYSTYMNSGTSRSDEPAYNEAIDHFNKKEYNKAIEGFQAYLKYQPENSRYEFFNGISNMEIKNFPDAEQSFKKVLNKEANLFREDANWYLTMCYLATKQKDIAIKELGIIARSESIYKIKAKHILRHL